MFDQLMLVAIAMPQATPSQRVARHLMLARIEALELAYGCLKRALPLKGRGRAALMRAFSESIQRANSYAAREGYHA